MIRTRFALVKWTARGCISLFDDGSTWGAFHHPEQPHYPALAHRLGYEGDTLQFCREHEVAHHLVGEEFGEPSRVLWMLAQDIDPPPQVAASEEALAFALQRYARANEVPLIDGVDWPALRSRFVGLVELATAR